MYAYVDGKQININDYVKKEKKSENIKCKKDHILVCINGGSECYFRHKNILDVNSMTEWHNEWQKNFTITEKKFGKIDDQIKKRRADVLIEDLNLVLEFQHSEISEQEVKDRKKDYSLHKKEIYWIVDGNDNSIEVRHFEYTKRTFLEFKDKKDHWKYLIFLGYDFIFLDIRNKVYKIYPKYVKNNMIDTDEPFEKNVFINNLKTKIRMDEINVPPQCKLYIKQQGAGNGKTYGLVQMLQSKEFEQYKCMIIVSKQHSAKTVIYKELEDQYFDGKLKHIKIHNVLREKTKNDVCDTSNKGETNDTNNTNNTNDADKKKEEPQICKMYQNKYNIKYLVEKNDHVKECEIIIGTIDSLMYQIGNKENDNINKFAGLVESIIKGYLEKGEEVYYGNKKRNLNKEICLICDETQDLTDDYAKAIIEIMKSRYIDSYIVGDKLQSISYEKNGFTYLLNNEHSCVDKIMFDPINICRRFKCEKLIDFVNFMIPFEKYKLKKIEKSNDTETENKNEDSLVFIEGKKSEFCEDKDENEDKCKGKKSEKYYDDLQKEVEKIVECYDAEVKKNKYSPNDFLIVTPFTKKNPLVELLETALNAYWHEKLCDDDYTRYAIFHKSEEGSSIDLTESKCATRIVSIHSSKGDGRNVVFVIGVDESSLKKFSEGTDNLIYDSLLHVAITRMKKTMYFRYIDNGDDISKKIKKYMVENKYTCANSDKVYFEVSKKIPYKDVTKYLKKGENYDKLKECIINKTKHKKFKNKKDINDKKIVDMGHHNIRYFSMVIQFYLEVLGKEKSKKNSEIKKQILAILMKVKECNVFCEESWKNYYISIEKKEELCIFKMQKNSKDYEQYYDIIRDFVDSVKNKAKEIMYGEIKNLCPYESVILYYMTQILHQGIFSNITISELYNITHIYSHNSQFFDSESNDHKDCLCKEKFVVKILDEKKKEKYEKYQYLVNHYEKMSYMSDIYKSFLIKEEVNWLVDHHVSFNGCNEDLNVHKKFGILGYNEKNAYIVYIKPQFNELNYYETLVDSILDTYLLKNVKKDSDNCDRFDGKNIITIVFTIDDENYIQIEWKKGEVNLVDNNKNFLLETMCNTITQKYIEECKYIYYFFVEEFEKIKKENTNVTQLKIIKRIIDEYKSRTIHKDNIPHFIVKFFEIIEYEVGKKRIMLEEYLDKTFFKKMFDNVIKDSVSGFFGFDPEETSKEEELSDFELTDEDSDYGHGNNCCMFGDDDGIDKELKFKILNECMFD
jgi:hypothetical protein